MSQRQKIILAIIVFAMCNLLLVVLFGDNGWIELRRLDQTHRNLVKANGLLTKDNLRMYKSIDRLQTDPEYIESIARKELGMIRSNELIFQFKRPVTKP